MVTVYKELEIDVELHDFDDEDILDEFERRGLNIPSSDDLGSPIYAMYHAYRAGRHDMVDQLLCEYFYTAIGKIV